MVPSLSADPVWRAYQRASELPLASSPCATTPHSEIMRDLAEQVEALGNGDAAVLILGEPGLAKGCHADAIHAASSRHSRGLGNVACVGLERDDFERLFGNRDRERSAFSASDARRIVDAVRGGSLFFNEVGALNPGMQAALLQILTEGALELRDAGAVTGIDVRVIASSSLDLVEAVNDGRFREDLYYRLSTTPISIPPVRGRGDEDVMQLLDQITRTLALELHGSPSRLAPQALHRLVRYPWPGNIREIRNVMERAMVAARGLDTISLSHLPPEVRDPLGFDGAYVPRTLAEIERLHIERSLRRHRQNRTHAATELGISRATLIKKIREYGFAAKGPAAGRDADDELPQ